MPAIPRFPALGGAIDGLGNWVGRLDDYLKALESLEPTVSVAEAAYSVNVGEAVKSVVLIPGSGEFVYDTIVVEYWNVPDPAFRKYKRRSRLSYANWAAARRQSDTTVETEDGPVTQQGVRVGDVVTALDQLAARFPRLENVAVIVSWFGSDLRAGDCAVRPLSEDTGYTESTHALGTSAWYAIETQPYEWSVAGVDRRSAGVVPYLPTGEIDPFGNAVFAPAYGGTPADASVVRLFEEIRRRGWKSTFYPFLLMEQEPDNGLPDPYSGAAGQPAFPWRGRITCHPAPGRPGTVDRTAAARTQLAAFAGRYEGFVLHYARLLHATGLDTFILGSELRGLTWVRDETEAHPFVGALVELAAKVRAIVGPGVKLTYAADWSEFTPYQTPEGGLDFHLDQLWASPNIDAIGIDCYWPTSDWRGVVGIDEDLYPNIYDPTYLAANVQGGEGYDFYYASEAARISQERTPIGDSLGKPWVFRYKDIRSWWENPHHNRPAGMSVEGPPTAWVPRSKPIWFTELGCPAVDKGSNQPNVFIDPKSSESFAPYFSLGVRDDLIQIRHLMAFHVWYAANANNPESPLYAGRMLDTSRMYLYCWDARPYPFFPDYATLWADAANWERGHWLNGRQSDFAMPTPPPGEELPETERVDLMPATPMPKDTAAVDLRTGKLTPGMQRYLAQIELIARRIQNLQIVSVVERDR